MVEIRSIKLDLLRGGPAHNQLLSPLTPYLALCGAEGPVPVRVPFEHAQLLTRLERLRYAIGGALVAPAQREAEVHEMGRAIGDILGEVPGLLAEIGRVRGDRSGLLHLRLSVSAYELALMPFELAIGPEGFPGGGAHLLLQSIAPVSLTRELRRGHPLSVHWDRPFKILFAFASPEDLPPVPAQEHLEALRRAIDPWTRWQDAPAERVEEVKRHLTVLPAASLAQIRQACAEEDYTHVHILAHGELDATTGRYGVALCGANDGGTRDFVDGGSLSTALTGSLRPTVVTLATCDSGNAGSVVTAGGSIAHALHAGGIPWVFASQFPLWMRASSIAVEWLYKGLLGADDPRWVLYGLRQRLRVDSKATHDWASIVAYAEIPPDFEEQVAAFRNRQNRGRIEVLFDKAEKLDGRRLEQEAVYAEIRHHLDQSLKSLPANASAAVQAEHLGIRAAAEKRIGNLASDEKAANGAYESARDYYRRALEAEPVNHWVATQFLSLTAVLSSRKHAAGTLVAEYGSWWSAARQISLWELKTATGEKRAWALGTLAELDLLGVVYEAPFDASETKKNISLRCQELCHVVGKDAFPVASTRRQFRRYLERWQDEKWAELANAAMAALADGGGYSS